ncbi:MAG: outer membrane lipoprotein carrier protein LolA [Sphingomonadaceae bacterium]|nr:outer membrane lipoprotein carrier protein LolA [Sphingomonadaceae bacterium]
MRALIVASLAAFAMPALAAPAASPELAQVQAHLRAVTTMIADFAQTDRNGRTLTGTLTLKRPGKVRFQYQAGVPLLIVGDGKALTMIDYQVSQVSRWPIGHSPLGVLLDPNADLSRVAKVVPSYDPGTITVEGRDSRHPEFGTISIVFAHSPAALGGLTMAGWTVVDAQNNRSTVRLSNQRFNVPVSDEAFAWRDPRPQGPRH